MHGKPCIFWSLCASFLNYFFLPFENVNTKRTLFYALCFMGFLFVSSSSSFYIFLLFCRAHEPKKNFLYTKTKSQKPNSILSFFPELFLTLLLLVCGRMKRHRSGKIIQKRNRLNFIYCPSGYSHQVSIFIVFAFVLFSSAPLNNGLRLSVPVRSCVSFFRSLSLCVCRL